MRRFALVLGLLWCIASSAFCFDEFPDPKEILTVHAYASYDGIHPGMDFEMALVCTILDGWHVNSHEPTDQAFVATEVQFDTADGLEITDISYPRGILRKFAFSDKKLSVYEGELVVRVRAMVASSTPPSEKSVRMTLRYQACDDRMCLEPAEKSITMPLEVVGISTPVKRTEAAVFTAAREETDSALGLEEKGVVLAFLLIFVGGLALNLTPCIYPMIPITISYFGGQSHGSSRRLLILAAAYVVGIAITYSVVGLIAALTGSLLGAAMQNPIVLSFVALVLTALALGMFDVYTFSMPARLTGFAGSSRGGIFGSLFMGLTLGIVIAPCVGPFVLGLLTYVGRQGNPILGFFMFFTLAVGMGIPIVVLGVISGSISRLPRSGEWMIWIKKIFGFILLAMAVYFLRTIIPDVVYWLALAVIALSGGFYLGWIEKVKGMGRGFSFLRRCLGLSALAFGVWLVVAPDHLFMGRDTGPHLEWQAYAQTLVEEATEAGVPVIIDFSANWCVPCCELDEKTFNDPRVIQKASRFTALRVDLTQSAGRAPKELIDKYSVVGVPTVVFIGGDGRELEELRFVGFIGPDSLLVLMDEAVSLDRGKVGVN